MYYSDYKKKNGYARKSDKSRNFQTEQDRNSYYSHARHSWPEDRFRWENPHSNSNRERYYEDEGYENYRHQRDNDYSRDYDNRDQRNVFERAGDRIKQSWNDMTRDEEHRNDYLKSRYNQRQAGYDNGEYRNRPHMDEEYGYRHQRATHGYEGDNRTYNDNGYDRRYDEYERRYDGESNRYNANASNDDYYTGYREFDRNSDRRGEKWRGRFAW